MQNVFEGIMQILFKSHNFLDFCLPDVNCSSYKRIVDRKNFNNYDLQKRL